MKRECFRWFSTGLLDSPKPFINICSEKISLHSHAFIFITIIIFQLFFQYTANYFECDNRLKLGTMVEIRWGKINRILEPLLKSFEDWDKRSGYKANFFSAFNLLINVVESNFYFSAWNVTVWVQLLSLLHNFIIGINYIVCLYSLTIFLLFLIKYYTSTECRV